VARLPARFPDRLARRFSRRSGFSGAGAVGLFALLVGTVVGGCSSSKPTDFVGNWAFTSGSLSGTGICPGLPTPLTGQTFSLTKGTTSDLVSMLGTCLVTLSVDGNKASAAPAGQMCQFTLGGMAVDVSVTSWTLESMNGADLTTNATGSALGVCTFTLSGGAHKGAGGDASAD
jgi:hypothetical protein